MRKALSLLLALAMCLSLCACGKSAAAETVDRLIEAIGTVTLESERAITEAENAYAQLPDSDKKKVENLAALMEARTAYNDLVEVLQLIIEENEARIDEASKKLGDLDIAGAYDLLLSALESATEAQLTTIESMFEEINNLCYPNTHFIRFENITTADIRAQAADEGDLVSYYYYNSDGSVSDLPNFFGEYDSYLYKYYTYEFQSPPEWVSSVTDDLRTIIIVYDDLGNALVKYNAHNSYGNHLDVYVFDAEYVNSHVG